MGPEGIPQPRDDAVLPVPEAFILCNQVIIEEGTKKKTLIGLFNRIFSDKFPTNYDPISLYFLGSDAQGTFNVSVQYVQVATQKILAEATVKDLQMSERNRMELSVNFPGVGIPEPGEYEFRLFMNGRYIHRARFNADYTPH